MQAVKDIPVTDVPEGSERDLTEVSSLALGGKLKRCLFIYWHKRLTGYQSRKKSKPGNSLTRQTHPEEIPVKVKKSKTQQTKTKDKRLEKCWDVDTWFSPWAGKEVEHMDLRKRRSTQKVKLIRAGQTITAMGKVQKQETWSKDRTHEDWNCEQEITTKSWNHGTVYHFC